MTKISKAIKSKAGRKPLPKGNKREMHSTRLAPDTIATLKKLKSIKGKPMSRVIEDLIAKEAKRLGL
jgi:hypothetical protein|tara:strand:+ start:1196 stop:1396 length:201 start_codon:yes stop_codon:yes gene_type:complete